MAELGFGLLASYLPILPRLYQRLANLNPYMRQSASAKALKDPETRAELSRAARKGLGPGGRAAKQGKGGKKGTGEGGDWIHLDDTTLPNLPERTTVDIKRKNCDKDAFDMAVEGREGYWWDVEKGKK